MAEKFTSQSSNIDFRHGGIKRGGPGNPPPGLVSEKAENIWPTIKRLIKYLGSEKKMLAGLFIAVIFYVIFSVIAPSLQSSAIDCITYGEYDALLTYLMYMAIVYCFYSICSLIQGILSAKLSQSIVKKMRCDLFAKVVRLPIGYIDTHPHGDIMSRMTNDVENVSTTISQSLTSLVSGVLTLVGTVLMMVYYSPLLALLSCLTVILTVIATKLLTKAMRKYYTKRQELLGDLNSKVEENIVSYKTVVAYNRQAKVGEEFDKISDDLTKTGIIAEILGGSMGPIMNVISNIGFVIIAFFGGYFALNGYITIGVISAFIVYAKQFSRPINEIAQIYGQIQTAIASAERVFIVIDEETEPDTGTKSLPEKLKGSVSFKDVNFSYIKDKQVLYDFNLDVYAGHKVALVGATGSGKTTVVNLLMRFYDIDSGEITIDGINIKDLPLSELRKTVAIVLQDTVLFSDTVRKNLKYSNQEIDDEQMENAARMSHSFEMIKHLPEGFDTKLTESGQNLSQGQRQLLSIARAFLADPKILILDEATSSVDTRTEKHIQDAMVKLMSDRTSLIIAHRISTIQDADFIVVMDNGRVIETGNHEQLMAAKGKYYELCMTQYAGNKT